MHFKIGRSSGAVLVALGGGFLLMRSDVALPSNLTELKGELKVFEAVIDGTMASLGSQSLSPARSQPVQYDPVLAARVAKRFGFVQQKIIGSKENSPRPYLGRDRN